MSMRGAAAEVAVCGSVGKSTTAALARAACDADRLRVTELHPGDQPLGAGVPDVGVVTTLAGADGDLVGALTRVIHALPATATVVLNVDDPHLGALARDLDARVLRVSSHDAAGADLVAQQIRLDARARPSFTARTPWGAAPVALPVSGRHHVTNALCALAVACVAGSDLAAAVAGLVAADTPRGTARERDGLLLVDDTGHASTVSMLAALEMLAAMHVSGQRVGVLGPMDVPEQAHETEHWRIGMRAARVLDRLVVVGEAATPVVAGARDAAMPRVELVHDAAGVREALAVLAPGDAVLVKGGRSAGLEAVVDGLPAPRRAEGVVS